MPEFQLTDGVLHYTDSGNGKVLALVHGFPLDSRIWDAQVAELSTQFRVITIDLRGFGKSKTTRPFNISDLANDVYRLLSSISAVPCALAGLSMGGYVALELASKYPDALNGLLLVDTKAEGDTPEGKKGRDEMIDIAKTKGAAAIAEKMMPKMHSSKDPAVIDTLQKLMLACPAQTTQYALAAMRDRADHMSTLSKLNIPAAVIVGESDAIISQTVAKSVSDKLSKGELKIIPGAGHMAPIENPAAVNKAIAELMARV